jgi:protein gp37
LNKQGPSGIEWTEYTWNPIGGCKHACRWNMPDGSTAICYAEKVAEGIAAHAYPNGFDHHYWNPQRLSEPAKVKEPSRIFLDSMSDLFGNWVPEEQIQIVLDVCRSIPRHTFQALTKNAPRLLKFAKDIPANVWIGASMPPSEMLGHALSPDQQQAMMLKTLRVMWELNNQLPNHVKWMSLEPLSFDVSYPLWTMGECLDWLVIGAASNGRTTYQPNPAHVQAVLDFADSRDIASFMKGNLAWEPRWAEYPR